MASAFAPFARLEDAVELLDRPDADPRAVEEALVDLARINRLLGGTRLTQGALATLLTGHRGRDVTVLDAGCGGGDMAVAISMWARGRGLRPHVLALDASAAIARIAANRVGRDVEVRIGDMLALDLADHSVDLATCSLVVHHLEPDEAVRALRELRRVARLGVVVNDLVRTRVGLLGAKVLVPFLTRNPITRHDAVVSARRAYARRELLELVRQAGLRPVDVRQTLGYRVAIAARSP